jgi:hypothetical protein
MELPSWALLPMWVATLIGGFFLTKEVIRRYG